MILLHNTTLTMNAITATTLIELSLKLAQSLTKNDRFDRLLSTIRQTINCDAVALLSFKDDHLIPLACQGLSKDTLGRRFAIAEHPRFTEICQSSNAVRFTSDSTLPDPYDGMLINSEEALPVHACMGLPLYFDHQLLGILTLDSLSPGTFDEIPERTLEVIAAMASVSLHTAMTLELLENNIQHSQQVVSALSQPNAVVEQNELIGHSSAMQKLKQEIALVGASHFNVLIEGESGAGKELIAHAIHQHSARRLTPMVYVNCAALPDNLIESELFGHVKGAFTGADSTRLGKFVIADGSTLFLDEVGELPLTAQSKLLRAIQSNEIQAVGQDKTTHVDVRIIAATNRQLEQEVEAGRFRADLFHRLHVYPITVPPLRERHGDIELLCGFFVEKIKRKLGFSQLTLAPDVLPYLTQYDWPGNVRELEHFINRAALKAGANSTMQPTKVQRPHSINPVRITLADCDKLTPTAASTKLPEDSLTTQQTTPLQTTLLSTRTKQINLRTEVDNYQRELISHILNDEKGNWSVTAKRLSTDRANLTRLAKRLGIYIEKQVKAIKTD
ncbi:nitric oxide reductase transcriptional regulator NorR [Flocculibacter collagenilyticus]|uniref:nitric oxide reductase transcriptional regulator NorR n=1 Tax=Flocculibacter collagenilyticus TaxID=2744479 RepID=UPI001F3E38C6|nr:nitric oxide reductase transcriptional regulator NorR [Flocculibacter collagenilyticus]